MFPIVQVDYFGAVSLQKPASLIELKGVCVRILLPKFGEWDVNNPASAEGFTVIFTKARDQKMSSGAPGTGTPSSKPEPNSQYPPEKKWFCCM
ncbi:PREDICTED: RPM1-interacting protein 4 [Prunus mume]|uniref:RPM1-interacting protein 4 n=1 Tax=Prunus mume TaxID=102107 RepID=A0ABM0NVJ3_PRUMU|nr:PREDICTED: RPM1-interacting protein 4 [Prunus mume]